MRKLLYIFYSLLCCFGNITPASSQQTAWNTPSNGNPIIPGYFADPTVKKFGDTYYIYATTDGNGGGLGPSVVWASKDFQNWTMMPMNWPTTYHIWAPDVLQGKDGKYYMYYCEPCKIYCGVSDTPTGPWHNILGDDTAVLVPDRFVTNAITLDGQSFVDDDGSTYLYWGTWGIYKGFGCGVGKLSDDMKSFTQTHLIPNTEATDFFEAPFMMKRNGIYYFMYSSGSCHDHTYRVQYATSKVGPMGPFTFGKNNPILSTNADSTIHGPGHHSILQEGDDYYIVYHRHNIPHSTRGMHRQIAIDKLIFSEDGTIERVDAGHLGVGCLQPSINLSPNLALGKSVKASSYYNESFKPEYAVDDNNATLWRPRTCGKEWIEIDLKKVQPVRRIWTQFEYPTSFYQYMIETSTNGKKWTIFADKRDNRLAGSPMTDFGNTKARYIRLTVTGGQKGGQFGAIWNIKVFADNDQDGGPPTLAATKRAGLFLDINADDYQVGDSIRSIKNRIGKGVFTSETSSLPVVMKDQFKAFAFDSTQWFKSDFNLPETMRDSAPYTLEAWVLNPQAKVNECIADLVSSEGELEKIMLCNGTEPRCGVVCHFGWFEDMGFSEIVKKGGWQHWVITYDGYVEKVYLNGKKMKEKDIVLLLPKGEYIALGKTAIGDWPFTGYLHSLKVYDIPFSEKEIQNGL
ncbi:family 43 glycosylhydrolase [Bacteroides ihuae]|uniref:family 43 glycosylhydrolase n=1 Tax=Bacteroides ihuae TaxID=1852362 RepID=UPI0008D99726|nr:family 43 glycosylhydrolase [Bacteroides ihuae]